MNKKLNTIALATSLASLGFCSLSFGWQTDSNSLFGTGVANAVNTQQVDTTLPPIVSTSSASTPAAENFPPIISGKLIRQVSAESPGIPTKKLGTFTEGGGLKPLNSIMSSKAPNVYRPPAPPKPAPKSPVARVARAAQPLAPQGSGTRSGSGARSVLGEIGQNYADGNYGGTAQQGALPDVSQSTLDRNFRATETYTPPNQSGVASNSFGQDTYADPNAGLPAQPTQGFADGTSYFDQNAQANGAPGVSNCATCGNGLTDGSCPNCGPGAGYSDGPIIRDYGTFGSVSAANRYLYLDALVMTRADGDIQNSNFGTLNDFDFSAGVRATFGTRADSIIGRELSFFALPEIDQDISRTDAPGRLSIITNPTSGIAANGINSTNDAFFIATQQTQRKESSLYAVEFNRTNWGWDLLKSFTGFRFLQFDDEYFVSSVGSRLGADGQPVTGDFTLDTSNSLFGAHLGGEVFYDVGYRWSASGFGKFGIFANFNSLDFDYNNDDFDVNSEDDGFTISTVAELGFLAHYQIRTNLRFRAGYNALFVGNVSSVADNLGQTAGLFSGFEGEDSDDAFFHGFNFGLEFYR